MSLYVQSGVKFPFQNIAFIFLELLLNKIIENNQNAGKYFEFIRLSFQHNKIIRSSGSNSLVLFLESQ